MLFSVSEMWKPVEARDVTLNQKITYWTFIVKGYFSSTTGSDVYILYIYRTVSEN